MRLVRGCGVSYAASCYLWTSVRVLILVRPWYVHLALCTVKRRHVPERVVLFSQVIVLALNTPKPKSMSALGMYCARVKWDVASVLLRTRYSLPHCTQNLIWACAQTDCSLPNLTIKVVPSLHLTFLGEKRSWDCLPPTTSRVRILTMRSLSDSQYMLSSMSQSHPKFMLSYLFIYFCLCETSTRYLDM